MSAQRRRDAGPPSTGPGEKDVLVGFLDYLRASVAAKAEGVPEVQARAAGVPSGTNLLGLVRHLTYVERHWLLGQDVRDWKATFHPAPDDTAEAVVTAYRETNAAANDQIASWDDLTAAGPRPAGHGRQAPSRRWTLAHLIEETARHAGHADILRELADGTTGR
ncbi:DinB family protein [Streptomyces sp. G5(2025)]|uniref:DinB family protein n=1 Tax=Streptomyces sp. G5(2025) TaxID=3406628 RepID=UPI003C228BE6